MTTGTATERDTSKEIYGSIAGNRSIQLVCGIAAIIVFSNYQYTFTLLAALLCGTSGSLNLLPKERDGQSTSAFPGLLSARRKYERRKPHVQ